MEISFVIPVYNGEVSIGKCIQELQKWDRPEEIEIIIIDDGSTDDTGKMCDAAAASDSRIKVMHNENQGQGIARNCGIRAATGKYLYFVDADDWVDTKEIYRLWVRAEDTQADVIMGGYYRVGTAGMEQVHLPKEGYILRKGSPEEEKRYHAVKTGSAFGYLWNKLYRRAFLQENELYLNDIRKMNMEDYLFNLKVWSRSPRFYCVDYPVYYYVTDNVSTTRRAEPDIHIKNVAMIRELIQYLKKIDVLEDNLDMVVPLIMRSFCWSLIKNIPYEGRDMKRLQEKAKAFTEEPEIREVIQMTGAARQLRSLPSVPQRFFYSFCMWAMRGRMEYMLCLLFYVFYPLMKGYVAAVLK